MLVMFINSSPAKCSIYESGRMVSGCLAGSSVYDFISVTIDDLDFDALSDGKIIVKGIGEVEPDALVVNWHFITLPLPESTLLALPGRKYAVVLEAADRDPLALTPKKGFDAYIVLDPSLPETGRLRAFPRPLKQISFQKPIETNQIPVVGSFGFPTPGKGFHLVVEAVGREFERAHVKINVPRGDYASTDTIHDEDYISFLARSLMSLERPGLTITVTSIFMDDTTLVEWCASNDLNLFMYTREQPGLSATTDQAILSGRPLQTISNPTFRHIHEFIEPYPHQSLKSAIATAGVGVAAMQEAWSPEAFRTRFEQLLEQLPLQIGAPSES